MDISRRVTGQARSGRRVGARRSGLVVIVIATMVLLTACQDWTQFMGGATHTGDDNGENIISTANAGSLHLAFTLPGVDQVVTDPGVTVSGGNVYAATSSGLVVSSLGTTGCSGSPTVCQPRWTAPTASFGTGGSVSQPTVADGMVYLSSGGTLPGDLRAFDANGVTNCSGVPKVCQALWTAATRDNWIPTIADGKVYVATGAAPFQLEAFDEAGTAGCTGVPVVCQPLFTTALPGAAPGSVDVSGGVAYVQTSAGLVAVDAAGSTGCSGTPVVCQPLWTAPSGSTSQRGGSPAVVDGHVFTISGAAPNVMSVFDAAGVTGCSGTPVVCHALGAAPVAQRVSSPLVSNGVVWLGGQAWDENQLVTSCSGPPLPPCAPLATVATVATAAGPASISLGTLLIQTGTSIEGFQT